VYERQFAALTGEERQRKKGGLRAIKIEVAANGKYATIISPDGYLVHKGRGSG
jgi:hypothetical protein